MIREKLKMTNLPALLVKGSLSEESTCMMNARYSLALQVFHDTGRKPPQFVLCRNIQLAESNELTNCNNMWTQVMQTELTNLQILSIKEETK